jgi:prefoldin subunit 5
MKNIVEVLKQKEAELGQLQLEVEALRVAIRLLSDDSENSGRVLAPTGTSSSVKEIKTGSDGMRQFP